LQLKRNKMRRKNSKRHYNKGRYSGFSDGTALDVLKNKVTGAAGSITGGVNKAFSGVKVPDVNVAITKETQGVIYKAVGMLSAAAIITAFVAKR
jgi:hypothetical protein